MAAEADARVGSLVDDRYKVIEAMASGSMGTVYKAERVPVGKLVAIKFLKSSFANDTEFLGRFERETQVMSKLAHPNCVSVVDFGVYDSAPYLVMEYVAGTTLRQILDNEGSVEPARALLIARQIAAGLAHAHAQGIVHRDVKPANVMISDEIGAGEHVRILDFGLARLRGNVGREGRDATQINMVVGTPNYMAPEQTVPGGSIDARTDIYAVGVVLYEMIAGQRPFSAEDTMTLLGMHRAAPIPRLANAKPDLELPEGVQEVIDKAMAKSPADRYQTAVELAEAIDLVIDENMLSSGTNSSRVFMPKRARTEPGAIKKSAPTPRAKRRSSQEAPAVGGKERLVSAAMAPTLQVDLDSDVSFVPPPRRRSSFLATVLLLGAIGGAAYYLVKRGENESKQMIAKAGSGSQNTGGSGAVGEHTGGDDDDHPTQTGSDPVTDPGSAKPVPAIDAAVVAEAVDASTGSATPTVDVIDAGTGSGTGPGSAVVATNGSDDIEINPDDAVDPDPEGGGSGSVANDEAADAPPTSKNVEARLPPPQQLASTIGEAVKLIKEGKRETALLSLHALERKNPKSAYIPFLMGNLYYDKLWWGVALDYYTAAIRKNGAYRRNSVLNKNAISMLASVKTVGRAEWFLVNTVGRSAIGPLRGAAARAENPVVRRNAVLTLRKIR
jgi:eukaryotic-like serine/threonine-protein kinase